MASAGNKFFRNLEGKSWFLRNRSLFSRMGRVEVLQWDECDRDALRSERASGLREWSLPEG